MEVVAIHTELGEFYLIFGRHEPREDTLHPIQPLFLSSSVVVVAEVVVREH